MTEHDPCRRCGGSGAEPRCWVPACGKPIHALGLCVGHYTRHRKGDLEADRPLRPRYRDEEREEEV